jgi:hypothetical protein
MTNKELEAAHKASLETAERARKERDQWEGRLQVALEELLQALEADLTKAERKYATALNKFRKTYGDELDV